MTTALHPATAAIFNDAGLLREHIVGRFNLWLVLGAGIETHRRAMRAVGRLSRLTGLPIEQVIADLRSDLEEQPE